MTRNYLYGTFLATSLWWLASPAFSATATTSAATLYKDECASCHMAYPSQLLPARSWLKILNSLDHHFGDNASLDPATLKTLKTYLQANSADTAGTRRARRIMRSLAADETPLRISALPSIRRQHHEIPLRYITANPKVKSLSNCVACHAGAEQGRFNEDNVKIPGYGRWDD